LVPQTAKNKNDKWAVFSEGFASFSKRRFKMRRARFLKQKRKFATERSIKYRGSASIKIEILHFPYEKSRKPNKKEIERFKKLFQE
jgi:hypothetical protein